jgi:hypothetical protein
MAMTGADPNDGLALDRVPVTVGPFWPGLPPCLRLELELQGDVVARLATEAIPSEAHDVDPIFEAAQTGRVLVAALEAARARHLLEASADLLHLCGLEGPRDRALRLARAPLEAGPRRIRALLRSRQSLHLSLGAIGALPSRALRGPNLRAAGRAEDARREDPVYRRLGFRALSRSAGDGLARFEQRVEEAAQAAALALHAGELERSPGPPLEGPRGPMEEDPAAERRLRADLEGFAVGRAWDELLATLTSLDLAPWRWREARLRPSSPEDES